MTRYLISFDDGAMTFPEEQLPDVDKAAHAVTRDAQDAGVWVFAGGLYPVEEVSVVTTDGMVTDGPESKAYMGGLTIIDVPSREEALEWAAKVRRRLPLRPRGPRVPARPGRGELTNDRVSLARGHRGDPLGRDVGKPPCHPVAGGHLGQSSKKRRAGRSIPVQHADNPVP